MAQNKPKISLTLCAIRKLHTTCMPKIDFASWVLRRNEGLVSPIAGELLRGFITLP
jgi:hypothetical protein